MVSLKNRIALLLCVFTRLLIAALAGCSGHLTQPRLTEAEPMNDHEERPWCSQDLFCAAALAHLVTAVAVFGAVLLNASHTFTANAAAGPVQAGALAAIFGAIGLGGAVAAHLAVTACQTVHKATAVITLLISLSVSVSLGTQATGRADSLSRAGHRDRVAASLQEQRKPLATELAAMLVSVSPAEAKAAVETARAKMKADVLRKTNDCSPERLETSAQRNLCRGVIEARAGLARSERRTELLQQIAAIDGTVSAAGPTRAADPQAENIAWLLSLVGVKASTVDVGRTVNALTAFLVEAFAILSASLSAIARQGQTRRQRLKVPVVVAPTPAIVVARVAASEAAASSLPAPSLTAEAKQSTVRPTPIEQKIVSALSKAPGRRLEGSQRAIAAMCSVSKSTFSVAVKRLVASGALSIDADGVALAA